jgi:hypothetical protein
MKAISKILSYLFHPMLIPTFVFALIQYTNPFLFQGIGFSNISPLFPVFLFTFIYPAIAFLLLRKLDFIDSFEMPDKKQRIIPLIIAIILYVWMYLILKSKNFPYITKAFMLGAIISLFISFVINVFHKLSLHMVGISGALTMIMLLLMVSESDMSYYFLAIVVITGALATARLYLNAHTMKEVYTGFLVGMFGQVLGLMFSH